MRKIGGRKGEIIVGFAKKETGRCGERHETTFVAGERVCSGHDCFGGNLTGVLVLIPKLRFRCP